MALLKRKPPAVRAEEALALSTAVDRLVIEGPELYWLPEGGISESGLDLKMLALALGPMAIRTKGTVDQIAAKLEQPTRR